MADVVPMLTGCFIVFAFLAPPVAAGTYDGRPRPARAPDTSDPTPKEVDPMTDQPSLTDRALALREAATRHADRRLSDTLTAVILDALAAPAHRFTGPDRAVVFDDLAQVIRTREQVQLGVADGYVTTGMRHFDDALDTLDARAAEAIFRLLYGSDERPCHRCPRTVAVAEGREPIRPAAPGSPYCARCRRAMAERAGARGKAVAR